jgi:PilZ domain
MSGHPDGTPRNGYRLRTGIPAHVRSGEATFDCETINISRGGALILGTFPTPLVGTVEIAFKTPSGGLSIHLSARVVRVEPDPDKGGQRVALEFTGMDVPLRDALDVLLARLLEAPAGNPIESLKPGASPQDIKKVLESIPIAQRIGMSSRAAVKEREILRLDTNPAVLESLARNPGLTVAEARLLAASAYLMPGTLDALSNDVRFKHDDELRIAIAIHPKVSVATAERVTLDFKLPQLKAILAKPSLSLPLREKLFKRMTRR